MLLSITKEEYLNIDSRRYENLQALNKLDKFYDYEKEFVTILHDLRGKLEKNLGTLSKDNLEKKPLDVGL